MVRMYILFCHVISTYDHREWRTGLPVRSAVLKPLAGWLVVGWVTTSESQLLYVFLFLAERAQQKKDMFISVYYSVVAQE